MKKYLKRLREVQNEFYVVSNNGYNGWYRVPNSALDSGSTIHYNHRDILDNEIVIDLDEKDLLKNLTFVYSFINEFKNDYKFSIWKTAYPSKKTGFHIHLIFPEFAIYSNRKLIKDLTTEFFVSAINHKKNITFLYDKQLTGSHLIRAENGFYEKEPTKKWHKKCIYGSKQHLEPNKLPFQVKYRFGQQKHKNILRRLSKIQIQVEGASRYPICMQQILKNPNIFSKDGGKRGMFIIASWFRRLPHEKIYEIIQKWNENTREPLDNNQIMSTIYSVKSHKGRPVGCPYRHQILDEAGLQKISLACDCKRENE